MAQSEAPSQGMLLISVFLNAVFFGLVSQQFYAYWAIGFKDSIRLRLFIVVQFLLVAFQSLLLWHLAWEIFVVHPSLTMRGIQPQPGRPPPLRPWEGPINSLCQLLIILMANIYLASRIYCLTKSRMQCGVVTALSVIAFVLGMVTNVMSLRISFTECPSTQTRISVAWHAVQAVAESLITFFLARVLLRSRSGVRATDSTVNYIVRSTIQSGFLATAWAILALATWFLMPNMLVYRIFNVTSGTMYAHAIFETLLSRIRLRARLKPRSYSELGLEEIRREPSIFSGCLRITVSKVYDLSPAPVRASGFGPEPTPASNNEAIEMESLAV